MGDLVAQSNGSITAADVDDVMNMSNVLMYPYPVTGTALQICIYSILSDPTTGKKTIGFPAVVDNISLLYNKTVFDKAGVAYPTADWTWDDFRAAAKKITNTATQTYGYGYSVSGSEETTWQFWPHLWQNGGSILSADKKSATFDSAAGVSALTFLRDMAVTDKSVYLDQTDTKFGDLFVSNRIGMITSGPWELSDLKTGKTRYGVVQLPGGQTLLHRLARGSGHGSCAASVAT